MRDVMAMNQALRPLLLAGLLCSSALLAHAASPWEGLRAGQNRDQVAQALGVPVLRNAGRGHETWVYDAGASVQFHGGLVSAWTAPKPNAPTAVAPVVVARQAANEPTSAKVAAHLPAPKAPRST